MSVKDLVKREEELLDIADMMQKEILGKPERIVSRYKSFIRYGAKFVNGKEMNIADRFINVDKEDMDNRIFSVSEDFIDINKDNYKLISVARDIQDTRFSLTPKNIPLPADDIICGVEIPSNLDMYDKEFLRFSKDHPDVTIRRDLKIFQNIVVNSKGGKAIQTIPYLEISFHTKYLPVDLNRNVYGVCRSNNDVKKMKNLIRLLPDPTPDKVIRNSKSFYEAFQGLTGISGLVYGSMEDTGIKISGLYDIFIMGGVPIHEIVGHQFEEPPLIMPDDVSTFRIGQYIENENFIVEDDPLQKVEGLNVYGFVNFDAYGRRRNPVIHIKNGEVRDFLGGEYTNEENLDTYMGIEKSNFVGASTQFENSDLPMPRMSCTVLDGKTEKINMEGKIVMIPYEGGVEPRKKVYFLKSAESYIIKDGKAKRMVPLQVTGTINNALKHMQLTEDFSYTSGLCSIGGLLTGKPSIIPKSEYTRNQLWREQQVYPLPIQKKYLNRLIK